MPRVPRIATFMLNLDREGISLDVTARRPRPREGAGPPPAALAPDRAAAPRRRRSAPARRPGRPGRAGRRRAPRPRTPRRPRATRAAMTGRARRHRLQRRQAEALVQRRMHERRGPAVELGQPVRRPAAGRPAGPASTSGRAPRRRPARGTGGGRPAAARGSCAARRRRRRGSAAARPRGRRAGGLLPGTVRATTIRAAGTPQRDRTSCAVVWDTAITAAARRAASRWTRRA